MTAKEILIKICWIKHHAVYLLTDISLFTEKDVEDMEEWPDELCNKIVDRMIKNFADYAYPSHLTDDDCCAHCIYYHYYHKSEKKCNACTFGKRHFKCNHINSTHRKITKTLKNKYNINQMIDTPGILDQIWFLLHQKN